MKIKSLFLLCGFTANGNYIVLTDLLRYTMGLGFFDENPCTLEQARTALHSWVEKLQECCLLVGTEDKRYVKMHELVREVASRIAFRDQHILSSIKHGGAGELNIWQDKGFLEKCTTISFPCANSNILRLPEVMQCPTLQMLLYHADYSLEISPRFFEKMIQLKVLSLKSNYTWSLPKSLQFLENLRTLCLGGKLTDISLVGYLSNLEILSFEGSDVEELPKEIGQLTRLRLLDLSNCDKLRVIAAGVLSSLERLEELRMRNNSYSWRQTSSDCWICPIATNFGAERSNASLSELQYLSHLTALEIHVPDVRFLPAEFFSLKLERLHIVIGYYWNDYGEEHTTYLNTLQVLDLPKNIKLDHGLKMLLNQCEDLSLYGVSSVNHIIHQLDSEDLQRLKHLRLESEVDFTYINIKKVVLPNLTTLCLYQCEKLRFLFTSPMARNLVHLKSLEISECRLMEEIISSTREHEEGNMGNMFSKLEVLKLHKLENLTRFCTGSYIEFSSMKNLEIQGCIQLQSFIIEKEKDLNPDVNTVVPDFLFDDKVGFPSLDRLRIKEAVELKTIWHTQLAEHSFRRLREVEIIECYSLIKIFPHGFMRRLNALETLNLDVCTSLEMIFELEGSTAQDTHEEDHLKSLYCQNVVSISIVYCTRLKKIFPAAVAIGLQNLCELTVEYCHEVVEIVGDDDGVFKTSALPQFVFPRVTSLKISDMRDLRRFYPRMHTSKWPLLKTLEVTNCEKVKSFAAEARLSISTQEHEPESLFLIDKGSFQNLEFLSLKFVEMWNGPPPAELPFGKLNSIEFGGCATFFNLPLCRKLIRLQNLEKIVLAAWGDSEEIFVDEGIESSVGSSTLMRARCLKLYNLTNLTYIGKKSAGGCAVLVFPNLETLHVGWCPRLKNLMSNAISFQNLTTLKVQNCNEMEYLTTYSVAKSLVHLTTLKVKECESMVVLVASDRDDTAGNEIAFIRLQHLKLSDLPRLHGFCTGSCIVKVPSSVRFIVEFCQQFEVSGEWLHIMDPIQQRLTTNDRDETSTKMN